MKSLSFDPESFSLDQTLLVGPQWVGRRLDQVVGEQPGVTSRQMARRLILESSVLVNGHGAKPSSKVKDQDQIQIHIPPARPARLEGEPVPLDILYEDPWLVVLNKPAGVAVHPSAGHARGTLVHFLLAHCGAMSNVGGEQRPGIVHRLDKDTSGVLVAAKNNGTHNQLASQFKL
ncbi:MAG: RluA family pseudouridine synthase, partial [Deltaproteobacteria bacterium]|nr:RluA family pseudouridine synthase [Deltaproteobacteria bacterium]